MHSIERTGIVALIFLVVTVVAVLMWDGGAKQAPAVPAGPGDEVSAPAEPVRRGDPSRRLSLFVEGQEGPLARPAAEEALTPAPADAPGADRSSAPPAAAPRAVETAPDDAPPPASEPAVAALTMPRAKRAYSVRAGDTLSEIAERELGSSRRWPEIVAANPGLDPSRLRAGVAIQLPGGATGPAPAPAKPAAAAPARTWTVGPGESLWRIAERALGDGSRWKEIASLNPGLRADHLVLGTVLKLPAAPAASEKAPARERAPLLASASSTPKPARGGKVK
jgi:nucleoid-associated protein YgaU